MNDTPIGTDPQVTQVLEPRQRIFLPQSFAERAGQFWWTMTWHLLFRWSPPPMHSWRAMLLRLFGATVGRRVQIWPSVRVDFPWNLTIGDDAVIAQKVIINCMGTVELGPRTRISQYAHLCAGTHEYQRRDMRIIRRPISIGADVWIAADAFIGPGVTVGDGCLVAARSAAFHDLPAGQVCTGEPARPRHEWK